MNGLLLKPGTRLYSRHTECEVVVVRPPSEQVELTCGGQPMVADSVSRELDSTFKTDGRTEIGKRYTHPASGLEVLCTKGGAGQLAVDGQALELLQSRPLPSSD